MADILRIAVLVALVACAAVLVGVCADGAACDHAAGCASRAGGAGVVGRIASRVLNALAASFAQPSAAASPAIALAAVRPGDRGAAASHGRTVPLRI
jgi:hypothetical protein